MRLITKALAILIYMVLFAVATSIVFNVFGHLPGYNLFAVDLTAVSTWLIYAAMAFFVGVTLPRPVSFDSMVLWVVYYMHILPFIILSGSYSGLTHASELVIEILRALIISIMYVLLSHTVTKIKLKIRKFKVSVRLAQMLIVLAVLLLLALLVDKMGFPTNIASYSQIYQRRSDFKETVGIIPYGGALSRALLTATYTILPFAATSASYLLVRRMYIFTSAVTVIVALGFGLYVFALAAFKSTIALIVLSLVPAAIYNKIRRFINDFDVIILWFPAIAALASLTAYYLNIDTNFLLHYFRRVFIVPGMHVLLFLDIFPPHTLQMVRDAPLVVSQLVYGTSGSANSGLVGSGTALLGFMGIGLNMILFGFWLVITKSYAVNVPKEILIPLAVIYGYLFSNSATTTVFFSYGAILAPACLAIVSRIPRLPLK